VGDPGEPNFERTIPLLAMRGRMVIMLAESAAGVPVGPFYGEGLLAVRLCDVNASIRSSGPAPNAIQPLVTEGKLKARIDRVLHCLKPLRRIRLQEEATVLKTGDGGQDRAQP